MSPCWTIQLSASINNKISFTDLGHEIHRRTLEECNVIKAQAIEEAERAVWQQAELLKKETVAKAVKKVHAENEKVINKLIKAHEKTLKVSSFVNKYIYTLYNV